jgi:hypothetical protein
MYSLGLQLDVIRHALAGLRVLAAAIMVWLASHAWLSGLHRRAE